MKFRPTVFVQAGLPYLAARSAGYLVGLAITITEQELPHQVDVLLEDMHVRGHVDVRDSRDLAKVIAVHDVYWVAAFAGFVAWSNQ